MMLSLAATLLWSAAAKIDLEYHYRIPGFIDPSAFEHPPHQRRTRKLVRAASAALAIPQIGFPQDDGSTTGAVIDPTSYGADPTGKSDSTTALLEAVKALTALGRSTDFQGRIDLGGAILHLEGGVYLISEPIIVPSGFANFRIQGGTLKASPRFPKSDDTFVLQIGESECNSTSGGKSNKNCISNIGVQQLTIDAAGNAWGGLLVKDTMDANIGPAIMVVGFNGVGISLAGTGAGYIHESWLGQFAPGDPTPRSNATATAILLAEKQHDCDINNVIIWSGRVGVNSTNGANRIQGVHTWNLAGAQGGIGIILWGGAGRVQQSYLDYAPLVIRRRQWNGPIQVEDLAMVEDCLFLGTANIVLVASMKNTVLSGLICTGNIFQTQNTANKTVILDESSGQFVAVRDVIIDQNEASSVVAQAGKLGTRSTKSVKFAQGTTAVTIDFSESLIFGPAIGIVPTSVNCQLSSSLPVPISTTVEGNSVVVHLGATSRANAAVNDSVTCSVDQSQRSGGANV